MYFRLLILGCILLSGCSRPVVSPGHHLSLRIASESKEVGLSETTLRSTGETVFLSPTDIVNSHDFTGIRADMDERGNPCFLLAVNESAGQRLQNITAKNQGKRMAIVINGIPEIAIPIESTFSKTFQIRGTFSEEDTARVMAALTGYD